MKKEKKARTWKWKEEEEEEEEEEEQGGNVKKFLLWRKWGKLDSDWLESFSNCFSNWFLLLFVVFFLVGLMGREGKRWSHGSGEVAKWQRGWGWQRMGVGVGINFRSFRTTLSLFSSLVLWFSGWCPRQEGKKWVWVWVCGVWQRVLGEVMVIVRWQEARKSRLLLVFCSNFLI